MASYLKASIKRLYVENFLSELERNKNQYFFFMSKSSAWADENTPDAYTDTVASDNQVKSDAIAYIKINPKDILFALPRYTWTTGTSYAQYDDSVVLFDDTTPKIFYVVTSTNKVYKCMGNNSGGVSTVEPTSTISSIFATSDGYKWKYLATLREGDIPYEFTDYIPVGYATSGLDTETINQYNTQIQSVSGSIDSFKITSAGNATYPNSIFANSTTTVEVASYTQTSNPNIKTITVTESASKALIGLNTLANYVGYIVRVNQNTQAPTEVNNYGIITAATLASGVYTFTIQNDTIDFVITPTLGANKAYIEILPFLQIIGDGTGAYAFPVMNSTKAISSITVVSGGRNYSRTETAITSPKTGATHPTIKAVISPIGGHGSNILRELNVKDIIVIITITESDAQKVISGGSYRQFGIIKNAIIADGSGDIAGTRTPYYKDLTLISPTSSLNASHFSNGSLIIGTESLSVGQVSLIKSVSGDNTTITLKTLVSGAGYKTKQDRSNNYTISLVTEPAPNYQTGEFIQQIVPAGTVIGSSSYGFALTIQGKILSVFGKTLDVRLTTDGNFVNTSGITAIGLFSGVTAYISSISPSYGEYVLIANNSGGNQSFVTDGTTQKLYKVVEEGSSYFDLESKESYTGLHVLDISSSINTTVGAMDVTSSSLTDSSFAVGAGVTQGVAGSYTPYASGKVYHWEFINNSYGKLYLTDVVGSFKSVTIDGISGSTLGNFIVSDVQKPEIDRTSGEILYIDNVRPIQRTAGQKEEFRLRLGF